MTFLHNHIRATERPQTITNTMNSSKISEIQPEGELTVISESGFDERSGTESEGEVDNLRVAPAENLNLAPKPLNERLSTDKKIITIRAMIAPPRDPEPDDAQQDKLEPQYFMIDDIPRAQAIAKTENEKANGPDKVDPRSLFSFDYDDIIALGNHVQCGHILHAQNCPGGHYLLCYGRNCEKMGEEREMGSKRWIGRTVSKRLEVLEDGQWYLMLIEGYTDPKTEENWMRDMVAGNDDRTLIAMGEPLTPPTEEETRQQSDPFLAPELRIN